MDRPSKKGVENLKRKKEYVTERKELKKGQKSVEGKRKNIYTKVSKVFNESQVIQFYKYSRNLKGLNIVTNLKSKTKYITNYIKTTKLAALISSCYFTLSKSELLRTETNKPSKEKLHSTSCKEKMLCSFSLYYRRTVDREI